MSKDFREWYFSEYGHMEASFRRRKILDTVLIILENPKASLSVLRKKIALRWYVTMRTALDYINYAKMLIEQWNRS